MIGVQEFSMFTVRDMPSLIEVINTHPEWRNELRRALFPEIDLPRAFYELAEAQKQMMQAIRDLTARMDRFEDRLEKVEDRLEKVEVRLEKVEVRLEKVEVRLEKVEVRLEKIEVRLEKIEVRLEKIEVRLEKVEVKVDKLDRDVAILKGDSYERTLGDKATGIFGRFLRRGRDMANEIGEQLHDAEESGKISERELTNVLAADLLWGGKIKQNKNEVVLVLEVSWFAEVNDLERAIERAAILRTIGLTALPVVAGKEWTEDLAKMALEQGVVIVLDRQVEPASWEAALSKVEIL